MTPRTRSGEQAQQNLLPGVSVNSSKKSEDEASRLRRAARPARSA